MSRACDTAPIERIGLQLHTVETRLICETSFLSEKTPATLAAIPFVPVLPVRISNSSIPRPGTELFGHAATHLDSPPLFLADFTISFSAALLELQLKVDRQPDGRGLEDNSRPRNVPVLVAHFEALYFARSHLVPFQPNFDEYKRETLQF